MLILALFIAAGVIALASCGVVERHSQSVIASMSASELDAAIDEGCSFCEDVSDYLAEQERRKK